MTDEDKFAAKVIAMMGLCRIEDHTPGRITLKVSTLDLPRLAAMAGGIGDVEGKIRQIPGIQDYEPSIGWRGASVVVSYDPAVFAYDLWEDLCSPEKSHSLELSLIERLRSLFDGKNA